MEKSNNMSNLIAISATIADRSYRIKISPEDEEVVRKTLKAINEKLVEFKTQFAGKDMQDYVAMVLIWFATEQNEAAAAGIEKDSINRQLAAMEQLLDKQLSENRP